VHTSLLAAFTESQERCSQLETALAKSERENARLANEVRRLEGVRRKVLESVGRADDITGKSTKGKGHITSRNVETVKDVDL
jgi:hypothetical protein